MENPYEAPNDDSPAAAGPNSDLRYPRLILIIHLVVIGYFAGMTLFESGSLRSFAALRWLKENTVVQLVMCLASPACPVAMVFCANRLVRRSRAYRLSIIALDLVLSVVQVFVMLPLVS